MTTIEIILSILNTLLVSGGLVVIVTLRSTIRASRATAQATGTDANDKLMKSYEEHILNPVLRELEALRTEREEWRKEREQLRETITNLQKSNEKTNRKIDRLSRAVEKIPTCPHAALCPVSDDLQKSAADSAEQ